MRCRCKQRRQFREAGRLCLVSTGFSHERDPTGENESSFWHGVDKPNHDLDQAVLPGIVAETAELPDLTS